MLSPEEAWLRGDTLGAIAIASTGRRELEKAGLAVVPYIPL